jgi:2'-5' RNA ligase
MLAVLGAHIMRSLTPPAPLQIQISSIKPDPLRGKTRRIVARIWEPIGDLTWVWRTIDVAARAAGFAPDGERFSPHITLGRVQPAQRIRAADLETGLFEAQLSLAFAASEIALIRSDVSPHGAEHSRAGVIRLPTGPRPTIPSVNW